MTFNTSQSSPFLQYTWNRFSPRRNLNFLITGEEHFHGHLEITTKALSAWLVTGRKGMVKNAIGLETIRIIAAAETVAVRRTKSGVPDITTDFTARVNILGPPFFEQFYYIVGGIKMLSAVSSRRNHNLIVSKNKTDLELFTELMHIFHFVAESLTDTTLYSGPSMKRGCEALSGVRKAQSRPKTPAGARTTLGRYALRGSLLYAASTIPCGSGQTLLDRMRDQTLSYEDLKPHLEEWLSKARFVTESVLANAATISSQTNRKDFDLQQSNRRLLPEGSTLSFPMSPPYTPDNEHIIREKFIKKKRGPKIKPA